MDWLRDASPPGSIQIDAQEAIRRIQERDHTEPSGSFETDEVILELIRSGKVVVALTPSQVLAFWPVDLETGEPFDPDDPGHALRAAGA
jgi:hypothetical protein